MGSHDLRKKLHAKRQFMSLGILGNILYLSGTLGPNRHFGSIMSCAVIYLFQFVWLPYLDNTLPREQDHVYLSFDFVIVLYSVLFFFFWISQSLSE